MCPHREPAAKLIRVYSSSSLKFVTLTPIMMFNIICQFGERIFDGLDETEAA
jgi:hypothetical protein